MQYKHLIYSTIGLFLSSSILSQEIKKPRSLEDDIKANKEEPKVLNIIPWQENDNIILQLKKIEPMFLKKTSPQIEEDDLIDKNPTNFKNK